MLALLIRPTRLLRAAIVLKPSTLSFKGLRPGRPKPPRLAAVCTIR